MQTTGTRVEDQLRPMRYLTQGLTTFCAQSMKSYREMSPV